MTRKMFIRVLLANCLIIICFNLLMLLPEFKNYVLSPSRRIATGLCLYFFQFSLTAYLLKKKTFWLSEPYRVTLILKGLTAFAIVILLTVAFVTLLDSNAFFGENLDGWSGFLLIFIFNSLPGALMEEWLFRYFPVRFIESGSLKLPANVFFILMLLLFTLIHIPAYMFQFNTDLSSLGNIFVSGIFLFLIYFTTRNIVFTALFHAFCNNPGFVTESTLNWQYFYASVFLITLLWPVIENQLARRAAEKQDIQEQ